MFFFHNQKGKMILSDLFKILTVGVKGNLLNMTKLCATCGKSPL